MTEPMLDDPELESVLTRARRASPPFTLARQQQLIWKVRGRVQESHVRIKRLWTAAAMAAGLLLAVTGYRFLAGEPAKAPVASTAPSPNVEHWDLRDGSRIMVESRETVVKKTLDSGTATSFDLDAGSATFDVARRPERVFRVKAGAVTVEVLGTHFRVARQGQKADVSVTRGRVLVSWPGGAQTLAAGEAGTFPPPAPATPEVAVKAAGPSSAPGPTPERASKATADKEPDPEGLFAQADQARREGRSEDAIRYLKAIADGHPENARAPLAAFTRGRVLLESLNRPAQAAQAFAQARALSGQRGTLAEDALAREVEALRAAGNPSLARERAELYQRLFPNGIRLRQVMRSGGLQDAP